MIGQQLGQQQTVQMTATMCHDTVKSWQPMNRAFMIIVALFRECGERWNQTQEGCKDCHKQDVAVIAPSSPFTPPLARPDKKK